MASNIEHRTSRGALGFQVSSMPLGRSWKKHCQALGRVVRRVGWSGRARWPTACVSALRRGRLYCLEKEKKELNERMRILAKRLDHIERAYRKEERPLLAKDYEQQQANDRAVFEQAQKARIEAHRQAHLHDIETKKRLTRMLSDFNKIRRLSARGEARSLPR